MANQKSRIEKIYIASDHAGVELKKIVFDFIAKTKKINVVDLGPTTGENSVDYPDFAYKVGKSVQSTPNSFGILICGTGFGMAIAANKVNGIRAVPIVIAKMAPLAIEHNNINVLCLSARFVDESENLKIVELVLDAQFLGERHEDRVNKISKIEKEEN